MNILYQRKGLFEKKVVYTQNGIAHFQEIAPWGKKVFQVHLFRVSSSISFSMVHHFPFALMCLFLLYLGIKLILARWITGGWGLNFGLIVVCSITLFGLYYLFIGRKYGIVELQFDSETIVLSMQEKEYQDFQKKLSNLHEQDRHK